MVDHFAALDKALWERQVGDAKRQLLGTTTLRVGPRPSIFFRLSAVGLWKQQPKQCSSDFPLFSHFVQLFWEFPEMARRRNGGLSFCAFPFFWYFRRWAHLERGVCAIVGENTADLLSGQRLLTFPFNSVQEKSAHGAIAEAERDSLDSMSKIKGGKMTVYKELQADFKTNSDAC